MEMSKKRLIMDHAIQLFASKGIESTSIQEITEHCGISKGAFYLSFKSKDELISYIIDYFMQQITIEIDRVVRGSSDPQSKLYHYFLSTFNILYNNLSFTKIFIKEQIPVNHEEFIGKMMYYEQLINQSVLKLLNELYGDTVKETKYDLLIVMKGFVQAYLQLLLFEQSSFDFSLLAKSLVEKTNILASSSKTVILTDSKIMNLADSQPKVVTLEQVICEIDDLLTHPADSLELETLSILKKQLHSEYPSQAIIMGMINNLKDSKNYQWLIYLMKSYLQR